MLSARLASLRIAIKTLPSRSVWFRCGAIYAAYLLLAAALGFSASFLKFETMSAPQASFVIVPILIFFRPALLEEIVFRVLFIPHPSETGSAGKVWFAALISLALFVAMHPLNGLFVRTESRAVFTNPIFLTLAALMGAACTAAYRVSGSLWPPVMMHWITGVSWTLFLGGKKWLIGG